MTLGTAQIIQGNALALPLADSSVDLVCTSPPYFGLRSYQDGGIHYAGQIGSEATPAEFVDALLAATREMVRVLKPSGSIFVNLGDKYSGSPRNMPTHRGVVSASASQAMSATHGYATEYTSSIPAKSLMGIPWRYAIRCIDQLGLILRAEIIWAKPNGLPESVTDRVRRSHEQWFHLTKQPRYYAAVDEIREPHTGPDIRHFGTITADAAEKAAARRRDSGTGSRGSIAQARPREYDVRGKLPGSVWTIPTQPLEVPAELGVDHFAAYPMEWPRRLIQGWTPNGICTACGEGRRPVAHKALDVDHIQKRGSSGFRDLTEPDSNRRGINSDGPNGRTVATITGYVCACHTPAAPTRPAVVLDPFMGTGTTLVVARALGRNSIGVDLSADYCRLAQWRVNNPGQLAAALQVEKPDVIPADQLRLFEDGMP